MGKENRVNHKEIMHQFVELPKQIQNLERTILIKMTEHSSNLRMSIQATFDDKIPTAFLILPEQVPDVKEEDEEDGDRDKKEGEKRLSIINEGCESLANTAKPSSFNSDGDGDAEDPSASNGSTYCHKKNMAVLDLYRNAAESSS